MKHVFISLEALVRRFHVCSLKNSNATFSKHLLILGLLTCALINSSFTSSHFQASPIKQGIHKPFIPFKGKMTLDISNGIVGTGEASHIGRFNLVAQDDESNFPSITGTVTITAANGDQLFVTHSGNAEDLGNGILRLTFENTITGGTGRFAAAMGRFKIIATVNEVTEIANATIDGTISY